MERLAIVGSGDLGQLVGHYFSMSSNYKVVGFFDDYKKTGEIVDGTPVLGPLSSIRSFYQTKQFDKIFIAIGYKHMEARKNFFSDLSREIEFATFVHPSSYVDKTARVGKGVIVLPGCILDRNVSIGDNVFLNIGCSISHDSSVGAHSFLGPRVAISGFCDVGESNFLGTGTILKDNISTVGFTMTGAGAVVCKNSAESGLYVGVPAKLR